RSRPGRMSAQRGSRCGWFGYAHVTDVPRSRRWCASPSIEPSASASGFTWHAIATRSARRSTSTARSRPSGVTARLLVVQLGEDVIDPLRRGRRVVFLETELRDDLQPDLPPELVTQVRRGRSEGGPGCGARPVVPERGERDPCDPEVVRDAH